MKLYFAKGTCALSPHIILQEAGLAYQAVRVDLNAKRTADDRDYLLINPRGYVPALELDNGLVLTEGPAIVQYLADMVPEKKLAPPWGSFERYRLQEALNFISTELHKRYSALFNKALPAEAKVLFRDKLHTRLADFEKMLGDREFLIGAHFTGADAYAYTIISWSRHVGVEVPAAVQTYVNHIHARPSVQAARAAESGRA